MVVRDGIEPSRGLAPVQIYSLPRLKPISGSRPLFTLADRLGLEPSSSRLTVEYVSPGALSVNILVQKKPSQLLIMRVLGFDDTFLKNYTALPSELLGKLGGFVSVEIIML